MKTRYELPPGRYYLQRTRDHAGDSGQLVEALSWNDEKLEMEANVLEIGKSCRVGSHFTRMFGQDWWLTTPITEFISADEETWKFQFKTGNSVYDFGPS